MKIVQQLELIVNRPGSALETWTDAPGKAYFDPANYTGITAIYAEVSALIMNGPVNGYLEVYDYTNNATLAAFTFTSADVVLQVSADIKSALTGAALVGVRMKVETAGGSKIITAESASLIICQNTSIYYRKSATYLSLGDGKSGITSTNWEERTTDPVDPHLEKRDGIVTCYLEAEVAAGTGNTVYIDLYDKTDGAEVSGSEITSTDTAVHRVVSASLSLVSGHKYVVRIKSDNGGGGPVLYHSYIKILAQNFNKIASVPVFFPSYFASGAPGFLNVSTLKKLYQSLIDGAQGLVWELDYGSKITTTGATTAQGRVYDNDAAAPVSGTEHSDTVSVTTTYVRTDTPVIPGADHVFVFQGDNSKLSPERGAFLFAFQEETLPPAPYFPPDPSQPTGYHSFISQFVKNSLAGTVPLKTPDGVNLCW